MLENLDSLNIPKSHYEKELENLDKNSRFIRKLLE